MTNVTLYVPPKDKPVWNEAQRYLKFCRDQSLSAYLTEHLKEYVAMQKAKHPATVSARSTRRKR